MAEEKKERPVWLDKWMTERRVAELYSPGMRSTALSFLMHADDASIEWTNLSLRGVIDNQHCSFRLAPSGEWIPRCTCGYTKPHCIHTYMLHVMLKKVCREEGWSMPGSDAPGVFADSPEKPRRHDYGVIVQKERRPPERESKPRCLEVEADFKFNPCNVVIRFYVNSGYRNLEDLCWIRDFGVELQKGNPKGWNDGDCEFLTWVLPKVRRLSVRELMSHTLVLPKDGFKEWMERWGDVPGRLIDRDTQKPLNEKQFRTPVRMQVELFKSSQEMFAACVFYLEDGRKFFLHDLVSMIQEDPTGYYIGTKLKGFRPVVSWDSLVANFGRSRLRLSDSDVLKRLPLILEHHLEVMGEGPYVTIRRVDASSLRMSAFIDSRGRFAVSLQGKQAGHDLKSGIFSRAGGFDVILVESHAVEGVRELLLKHGGSLDPNDGSRYLFSPTMDGASSLAAFWSAAPRGVERRIAPELQGLLGGTGRRLDMHVTMQMVERFVQMSTECRCGDEEILVDDLRDALLSNRDVVRGRNGQWFRLAPGALSDFMARLRDENVSRSNKTWMMPSEALSFAKRHSRNDAVILDSGAVSLLERLKSESRKLPPLPEHLETILRPYQKEAVRYLGDRSCYGVGSILADDMGLGKTLETLALLISWNILHEKEHRPMHALVVAPASVVDVWRREVERYCPGMRCQVIRGSRADRERQIQAQEPALFITSYALVRMDSALLSARKYDFLILDEAQNIKNPQAQITSCVCALNADCRIALTGTPLENRLSDVASILEFVNPGCLGGRAEECGVTPEDLGRIRAWLKLVMLRRTKDMVKLELPPRTEEVIRLEMTPEVREAYELEMARAQAEVAGGGMTRVLAEISRMRRFCCSPELVRTGDTPYGPVEEIKMEHLLERGRELIESGHSLLVFSQFTSLLERMRERLARMGIPHFMITGSTPPEKRGDIAHAFNTSKESSIFLLSLKAAGTGLTLTRADYVFLFDPWWNPSVENQAIDRTHRLGQTNPVFAYKMVLADSIEDNVMRITEEKRRLFHQVIDEAAPDQPDVAFSEAELRALLK